MKDDVDREIAYVHSILCECGKTGSWRPRLMYTPSRSLQYLASYHQNLGKEIQLLETVLNGSDRD
jgi:hypothetical protein